jgi:tetratricopeptide (TPR) repeat protein
VKVERALRILPAFETVLPLRGLLLSCAVPDLQSRWASAAPYLTVGKWAVSADGVRRRLPAVLREITEHVGAQCERYAAALEAEERGDLGAMADQLLRAARAEEARDRPGPATRWAEAALRVAEGLHQRGTEIAVLVLLGRLGIEIGRIDSAARHLQRALALAEAESDIGGTVDACAGLGEIALRAGKLVGAEAWLRRGEALATTADLPSRRARLLRRLAESARLGGNATEAVTHLSAARALHEQLGEAVELAWTLVEMGTLDLGAGRHDQAESELREALAWQLRSGPQPKLEAATHFRLAELAIARGRSAEGEEELRTAERIAAHHDLGTTLIEIYLELGALRRREGAELGFVFFEQALTLCELLEPGLRLEARVNEEYGEFKAAFGHTEEARATRERAHDLRNAMDRIEGRA